MKFSFDKISYTKISHVRIMNDDAKFHPDVKFGIKGTSKRFTTQKGKKQVIVTYQIADRTRQV